MLEVRLPVLDGPQAIRALRLADGPCAAAPIIGIIGGDPEEATACLEAGADQVLRKPFTVAGVARALAVVFAKHDQGAADDRVVTTLCQCSSDNFWLGWEHSHIICRSAAS